MKNRSFYPSTSSIHDRQTAPLPLAISNYLFFELLPTINIELASTPVSVCYFIINGSSCFNDFWFALTAGSAVSSEVVTILCVVLFLPIIIVISTSGVRPDTTDRKDGRTTSFLFPRFFWSFIIFSSFSVPPINTNINSRISDPGSQIIAGSPPLSPHWRLLLSRYTSRESCRLW